MGWFVSFIVIIVLIGLGSKSKNDANVNNGIKVKKVPLKTHKKERFLAIHGFLKQDDVVFIDTETTGLGNDDQIIEISILDNDGNILLDTFVCPTIKISKGSQKIHGITQKDVAKAPSWKEVYSDYLACTEDKTILAYNSKFDKRMVQQSCAAHNFVNRRRAWGCIMLAYSEFMGNTKQGSYVWHKLSVAAYNCGVNIDNANSGPHRALYDTGLALGVHRFMKAEVDNYLNKS